MDPAVARDAKWAARSLPCAISTLGDGRFLDVNEAFLRLLGCTRADVVGRTALDVGLGRAHLVSLERLVVGGTPCMLMILRDRQSRPAPGT
jgi:PAS domain-containing protein